MLDCLEEFRAYYSEHCMERTKAYEGISEMLMKCREQGIRIGTVSNKFESAVQSLCDHYLPGELDVCIGDLPGYPRKPDPANVYRALERLQITDKRCVLYVGDSETDVQTAVNAGLDSILVTWGFRSREDLRKAGACCMVDTADELWEKIQELY